MRMAAYDSLVLLVDGYGVWAGGVCVRGVCLGFAAGNGVPFGLTCDFVWLNVAHLEPSPAAGSSTVV